MEPLQSERASLKSLFYLSARIFTVVFVLGAVTGLWTDFLLLKIVKNNSSGEEISTASLFLHNFKINIMGILSGPLLGIIPLMFLLVNGFFLGYVIVAVVVHHSMPLLAVFYGIAPHAIPELCSFFLSCALGLRLGLLYSENRLGVIKHIKKELALSLSWLPIIATLTFIAAYIEINVSKALIESIAR